MLFRRGLGWQADLPDPRDYTHARPEICDMLRKTEASAGGHPDMVDLREYLPPVTDQRGVNSSVAHACVALVEYFQRRVYGAIGTHSIKFVYQNVRRLQHVPGDAGAPLRATLKALMRFGLPPAEYFRDDAGDFDQEPDPFLYRFTDELSAMKYVRLDGANQSGSQTLEQVKSFLASGFPSVFGFCVPRSMSCEGDVLFHPCFDSFPGGLAAVAVGYDDRRIQGTTRGSLLIRLSWGRQWGEDGYGWLPYAYVREQLASDFWTVLTPEWLESEEFTRPWVVEDAACVAEGLPADAK